MRRNNEGRPAAFVEHLPHRQTCRPPDAMQVNDIRQFERTAHNLLMTQLEPIQPKPDRFANSMDASPQAALSSVAYRSAPATMDVRQPPAASIPLLIPRTLSEMPPASREALSVRWTTLFIRAYTIRWKRASLPPSRHRTAHLTFGPMNPAHHADRAVLCHKTCNYLHLAPLNLAPVRVACAAP